jgi:WhiB family redox-sensing transcriptional regulator
VVNLTRWDYTDVILPRQVAAAKTGDLMWDVLDGPISSDIGGSAPALATVISIFAALDEGPLGWQERALCAQTDPEAFFPEKGGSTREAKKVCTSCEVRSECLDYALANDERFGIWGGLSERERRKLKRRAV